MKRHTFNAALLLFMSVAAARSQDTFSIVAVDPATGEVGSAGASCVEFDAAIISDLHPGVGAINSQAAYVDINQSYARTLMRDGISPSGIIDSLVMRDFADRPGIRQYGIVTLAGGGTSAGFTGTACLDYKGHLLGPTYAIQGNILLGAQILDSMEARFLRAEGPLAERLMAALSGADVPGADTRCAQFNASSLSAFVRVARPGDAPTTPYLDLHVVNVGRSVEPLDSLATLYDAWKSTTGAPDNRDAIVSDLTITPNPAESSALIRCRLARPAHLRLTLFDVLGREAATIDGGMQNAGEFSLTYDVDELVPGTYYCRLSAGETTITRRIDVGRR